MAARFSCCEMAAGEDAAAARRRAGITNCKEFESRIVTWCLEADTLEDDTRRVKPEDPFSGPLDRHLIRIKMQSINLPDAASWLDGGQAEPKMIIIDSASHDATNSDVDLHMWNAIFKFRIPPECNIVFRTLFTKGLAGILCLRFQSAWMCHWELRKIILCPCTHRSAGVNSMEAYV